MGWHRLAVTLGVLAASGVVFAADADQEKAIAAIKKLDGKVQVDSDSPDKPVVRVVLTDSKITDADMVHLKAFPQLESLSLSGAKKFTDAGLEHIKGLTKLEQLFLNDTKITDAGLAHLKGLTNLSRLSLKGTKVSDEAVKELQKTLTKLDVIR